MRTEFHAPGYNEDGEKLPFGTRHLTQSRDMAWLVVEIEEGSDVAQITGIGGRRQLTEDDLDNAIDLLTEARDYVRSDKDGGL